MRLLVIAPHPDDEALAAGGLIQQAGGGVVCYVTVGDGYPRAAAGWTGHRPPGPDDYLALGSERIAEARAACRILGARPVFLGFPDGALTAVIQAAAPVRSPYTGTAAVPYAAALDPGSPYTAAALLLQVGSLAQEADLIVAPWAGDSNETHRATAVAVAQALPGVPRWEYVVHKGLYPFPPVYLPGRRLDGDGLPGPRWEVSLTAAQQARKLRAIGAYASQVRVLDGWLLAFVGANEPFRVVGP